MSSEEVHLSEDTVSQSGWVFADLLVALSVIFLATISFIPDANRTTNEINVEPGKLARSDGFAVLYSDINAESLYSDIKKYRAENALTIGMDLILLQFIGSMNTFDDRAGILDALEFSLKMKEEYPDFMENVNTSLDTSSKIAPGEVLVRAVFGKAQG